MKKYNKRETKYDMKHSQGHGQCASSSIQLIIYMILWAFCYSWHIVRLHTSWFGLVSLCNSPWVLKCKWKYHISLQGRSIKSIYFAYYSDIKSEILPFTATWMDLEGIMLSEINQVAKDKYWVISLKIQQTSNIKEVN